MAPKRKKKVDPSRYAVSSTVKVSAKTEEQLKAAVVPEENRASPKAVEGSLKVPLKRVRLVQRVLNRLLSDGFTAAQIKKATEGALCEEKRGTSWMASEGGVEETLLDRLCFDVRPLPRVFATGEYVAESTARIVVHRNPVPSPAPQTRDAAPRPLRTVAEVKAEKALEDERLAKAAAARAAVNEGSSTDSESDDPLAGCAYLAQPSERDKQRARKGGKKQMQKPAAKVSSPPPAPDTRDIQLSDIVDLPLDGDREAVLQSLYACYLGLKEAVAEAKKARDIPSQQVGGRKIKVVKAAFEELCGVTVDQYEKDQCQEDDDDDAFGLFDDLQVQSLLDTPDPYPIKKLPDPSSSAVEELCGALGMKGGGAANRGAHAPWGLLGRVCSRTACTQPVYHKSSGTVTFSKGRAAYQHHAPDDLGSSDPDDYFSFHGVAKHASALRDGEQQFAAVVALFNLTREGGEVVSHSPLQGLAPFLFVFFDHDAWRDGWLKLLRHAEAEKLPSSNLAEELATILEARHRTADPTPLAAEQGVLNRKGDLPCAAGDPLTDEQRRVGEAMKQELATHVRSKGNKLYPKRQALPAYQLADQLHSSLGGDQDFCVVAGETGSGKTTQVPQLILDSMTEMGLGGITQIVCTQPRRIAAVSVAERVAEERGGVAGGRVGYHVRFDAQASKETKLLYCTTGILLRKLVADPLLSSVSHAIVDEVHERSLQGDFAIALLRRASQLRREQGLRPLKLVLMSATADTAMFSSYLFGCPILTAPGRTFPVQDFYLEDVYEQVGYVLDPQSAPSLEKDVSLRSKHRNRVLSCSEEIREEVDVIDAVDWQTSPPNPSYRDDLYTGYSVTTRRNLAHLNEMETDYEGVVAVIDYIESRVHEGEFEQGAILVFLAGIADIRAVASLLSSGRCRRPSVERVVIPLHSSVPPETQRLAFVRQREKEQKIVVATNIAETSVTVEDVVYVIDTGKAKVAQYDQQSQITTLKESWISKASAKQRAGRAGRVREGICFRMYTSHRHASFAAQEEPEVLRTSLTSICLQTLVLGSDLELVQSLVQPPPQEKIDATMHELQAVGAVRGMEVTVLGHHLARLPLDVRVGKLLLASVLFSVVSPALTAAAVLSSKSPFLKTATSATKAALLPDSVSDFALYVEAYRGYTAACSEGRQAVAAYCRKHSLDPRSMEAITDTREQLARCLSDSGVLASDPFSPTAPCNRNATKSAVLDAALCYALHPNVAVLSDDEEKADRGILVSRGTELRIHRESMARQGVGKKGRHLVYQHLMALGKGTVCATECALVNPVLLFLFASSLTILHRKRCAVVDDWLGITVPAQLAVIAKRLKPSVDEALVSLLSGVDPDKALLDPLVAFIVANGSPG
eukprot:Sspe_Gene.12250::Locus_4166_Transcript_1_9_Confidence_0.176_Length_4267::g.12250::m.12250/K18995/DHX29; ATP-dependent RNA helicase DHX29